MKRLIMIQHRLSKLSLLLGLALVLWGAPLHAAQPLRYLAGGTLDPLTLLAPPPLPDSPEQKFDLEEVAAVQHDCPTNEFVAALAEDKHFSVKCFAPVIGADLSSGKYPLTDALLKQAMSDAGHFVNQAKNHWKRLRPCVVDPSLLMDGPINSYSYPSGHSTGSMIMALILAELYPDKRDALIAEARAVGWHRVEIARHYPTDVFAGRVLAQAVVREMMKNPDFQKDLAAARAEIAATK